MSDKPELGLLPVVIWFLALAGASIDLTFGIIFKNRPMIQIGLFIGIPVFLVVTYLAREFYKENR